MSARVTRFKRLMKQHAAAMTVEWMALATRFGTQFRPIPELKVGALAVDLPGSSIIFYDPLLPVERLQPAVQQAFDVLARLATPEGKAEYDERISELLGWASGGPAPAWIGGGHG